MTVTSQTNTIPYPLPSGTSTIGLVYTFPFRIFLNADLVVTALNSNTAVMSTLVLGTDYTVTGMGAYAGGAITLLTDWEGSTLSITRVEPVTQLSSFASQGAFFPEMHEQAFDKLTMIALQFQTELALALQLPISLLGTVSGQLPLPVAGQVLGWNATLTGLQNYVSGSGSGAALQALLADPTMATNGPGLIGYNSALAYAAGTVGAALKAGLTITSLAANLIAQTAQAFATGGTGAAYTLTPTLALASNASPTRYSVTFTAAGSGTAPTLAVSGLAALPLAQYNASGQLVPCLPTAGMISDIECNGSQWIVLDALPKTTTSGGRFKNLIVTYGQSSGTVTLTCDECTVSDLLGNETRLTSINFPALATGLSAALSTTGAINGTDGSTQTAGNMYTVFVAYNPTTNTIGLVISAEPTSPTTPINGPAAPLSGYTQYACASINKIKAISPSYWQPLMQVGFEQIVTIGSYLAAHPVICTGTIGTFNSTTPTWAAQVVRGNGYFSPYHAGRVKLAIPNFSANQMNVAPNSAYGGVDSTTAPSCYTYTNSATYGYGGSLVDMLLESNSIYAVCAGSTNAVLYQGCTLNL